LEKGNAEEKKLDSRRDNEGSDEAIQQPHPKPIHLINEGRETKGFK
jgi:hypothetical protein